MAFPQTRLRRLRSTSALRGLVRETELRAGQLVLPLFVSEAGTGRQPIEAMPGVERLSVSAAVADAEEAAGLGVAAVLLFGLPAEKDPEGSAAWDDEGIVQVCTAAIKRAVPELLVITDVCLCEYTEHGHCGVLREVGHVDNDASVELLARIAVSHARAGADVVAPSDMMDGRVGAIRAALDDEGFSQTPIMAYSAKFASAFYGPFREAADSAPGVRRPARLPDGPGQRPRGGARGAARRRGGRGHGDGQARAGLRRSDPRGQGGDESAGGGVQRQRRVCDGQGRRGGRLPGRAGDGRWRSLPPCAARARTSSSPTTQRTPPDG